MVRAGDFVVVVLFVFCLFDPFPYRYFVYTGVALRRDFPSCF